MKLYRVSIFVNTPSRSRSRWPRIYTSPLLHAILIKKRSILSFLPPTNKLNLYCNKLNQMVAGFKKLYYSLLTTIPVSFEVKPVCVWNEILGSCFLCSVAELASEERDYPVKALASIILVTGKYACVWKICQHCLIDVSLQHPAEDRFLR